MDAGSVAALDSGATANLVCLKWVGRRKSILECLGVPRAEALPAYASFKLGDGRLGEVHCAAATPSVTVSSCGEFTSFAPESDRPASMRRGALGALGGRSDFARNVSASSEQWVYFPLKLNGMGHVA